MARYTGPTCKLARREGTDLFLKSGVKPLENKCKFTVPPGGLKSERRTRLSDYGLQLREKPVSIASFQVRPGDIVQVREKSRKQLRIQSALNVAQQVGLPEWVEVNDKEFRGVFKSAPGRDEVLPDINENLVVELYSK